MSRWRQKGFVLDSDEEDEESLESQQDAGNGRVECVDDEHTVVEQEDGLVEDAGDAGRRAPTTPKKNASPQRPTPSPITPISSFERRREPTDSPDPLQISPVLNSRQLQSPRYQLDSPFPGTQQIGDVVEAPQSPSKEPDLSKISTEGEEHKARHTSEVLKEFGVASLSDDSDEPLSDPPSDLDSPQLVPHGRTTLHVLIPGSTPQQTLNADKRHVRDFRQRKPIQLHPYALEGELYRREVQSRGLKPVPRAKSPPPRTQHNDAETQETEFNLNASPRSSQPELEIPVSTPPSQRSKKNVQNRLLAHHLDSNPVSRLASTELRLPPVVKKRKLNTSSTQPFAVPTSIFAEEAIRHGNWLIPPDSPPYSSSPLGYDLGSARRLDALRASNFAANIPTPSTSSVVQDDLEQLQESDSDPIPRSVQKSDSKMRRQTRIVLSDSESAVTESASDLEQSDNELRHVQKKIKGVLPASWLRFDRRSQERRKAAERERQRALLNASLSPEPMEPQRGVAQKVKRPVGRPRKAVVDDAPPMDIVIISEGSDEEAPMLDVGHQQTPQHSVEDASALAALFDGRYADDTLSDMENDRLHLPTLGGAAPKRKRQSKLTDSLGNVKRRKPSISILTAKNQSHGRITKKHGSAQTRFARWTPPPAMSVIDIDISPSRPRGKVPQFLRVARRQALQRPDLARQSPTNKVLRLQNAGDTEEANNTLQEWLQGVLKPSGRSGSKRQSSRQALADKSDNQQLPQTQRSIQEGILKEFEMRSVIINQASQKPRQNHLALGLKIFQRSSPHSAKSGSRKQNKTPFIQGHKGSVSKAAPSHRTAQLEEDEGNVSRVRRKALLQKGLNRAHRSIGGSLPQRRSDQNPILARFLAADHDGNLPPLPSAKDIGETPRNSPTRPTPTHKNRIPRKVLAHRVDADAREYRQPMEPTVGEVVNALSTASFEEEAGKDQPILQGLGPSGTQYTVNFDVHPLASETYFHSSTFVGSEEFRRALLVGTVRGRDLDEPAGYCSITHNIDSVRCGPWNDQTYSGMQCLMKAIWAPLEGQGDDVECIPALHKESLEHSTKFLRSIISYQAEHLNFLDPIDRAGFVIKMTDFSKSVFERLLSIYATTSEQGFTSDHARKCIRSMSYLLVLNVQIRQIAQHKTIEPSLHTDLTATINGLSRLLITHLVQHGIPELSDFLEKNKLHAVRMTGIQETDVLVESVVLTMHLLEILKLPGSGFWLLISQALSSAVTKATHVHILESAWATLFTFLPFLEFDASGIPSRTRKDFVQGDDWTSIKDLLKRLVELYPTTSKAHSSSLNAYVRANLARSHRLIHNWHWKQPEHMLNVALDFFSKNKLRLLRREANSYSVAFLENLASEPSFVLLPNENSFHITLKCLALGLRGMKDTLPEKKIRSFVFRSIPNHGRTYPKELPLDEESLAALRNHHDLLCTLYWAATPPCRPKLDHIRHLVNHETSHREACRLSVRAWANLTAFQLSTDEPYASAQPLALWHKEIMHQTLKQYRLAKTEADDYLQSGALAGMADVSMIMVQQTMQRNQEQVIATLRDCIEGMKKSIRGAKDMTILKAFLVDSDVAHFLELPHLEDHRLVSVIKETLTIIRTYTDLQKPIANHNISQPQSEESQDYGDFPDFDDFEDTEYQAHHSPKESVLDFIHVPLWHLISNAFGAETSPDEDFLMDCVNTWVCVAKQEVTSGIRSWSYYLDSYSQVSWQQVRHTEQTRKFGPYFLAALVNLDSTAYEEHRNDFMKALLHSLVEREALMRFQDRLLHAIVQKDSAHPLLNNLPFLRNKQNGSWDITSDTVRVRRLAVISSILSNMRDDIFATTLASPESIGELRRTYASLLKDMMTTMKNNYQQLGQGVTGAYVEFVQRIVQFLKQYTSEICPVLPFFTDSVAFPLPAADPTYVVGRLCGYAPKVTEPGTAKQLSVFIQTVAQQAASDNQHSYLVNQLTVALCTNETTPTEKANLRAALLRRIFPVYLEGAFFSRTAFTIARPILQALPAILDTTIFDLRIYRPSSVSLVIKSIMSISYAFVRGIERIRDDVSFFRQPHVISTSNFMFQAMISIIPLLEYIVSRLIATTSVKKHPLVVFMETYSVFVMEMVRGAIPQDIPIFDGDAIMHSRDGQCGELLEFCKTGLELSMKTNWSESHGSVWFGHGHAKREVVIDVGSLEEESARLCTTIERFKGTLHGLDSDGLNIDGGRSFGNDIIV